MSLCIDAVLTLAYAEATVDPQVHVAASRVHFIVDYLNDILPLLKIHNLFNKHLEREFNKYCLLQKCQLII